MNYSKAIFLISDKARAVAVTYEEGEEAPRTLFKTLDPTIAVNHFVVVQTGTRHGMTVCKVVEVDVDIDVDDGEEIKWVVGLVETADFDRFVGQENDAIERIKKAEKRNKREELAKKLLADAEGLKELPIYSKTE